MTPSIRAANFLRLGVSRQPALGANQSYDPFGLALDPLSFDLDAASGLLRHRDTAV